MLQFLASLPCFILQTYQDLLTFTVKTNKIMMKQRRSDVRLQLAPFIWGNPISAQVAEIPGKVLTIKSKNDTKTLTWWLKTPHLNI